MLPKPDNFGRYNLSDGSRIYPSGKAGGRPGEYLAWVYESRDVDGRKAGRFLTGERYALRYFKTPGEALAAIQGEKVQVK